MFCLCCWPCSTLFPYTTLFRSRVVSGGALDDGVQIAFPAAFAMRRDCFGRLRRRQPLQQGAQPVNVKGGGGRLSVKRLGCGEPGREGSWGLGIMAVFKQL